MNRSLKLFKVHPCDLVKTTSGNGVFELNLKNLVEKHVVYSIASIDLLFKDKTLNESIVQNTKSCVKIEREEGGWYDQESAKNRRAIARSSHKSHGLKNGRRAPRKDSLI
ncbi:hypothetical protein M9H77_23876 [Catharanthus roseus]|uniref:Uncharacterized protein n=1 Tax=Catharanthus roseus TaxID=4058 RepID=A0ACC0AYP5_CATRO|nr:hypothetical protein M9H77_23876 [Catharanthus roseus]